LDNSDSDSIRRWSTRRASSSSLQNVFGAIDRCCGRKNREKPGARSTEPGGHGGEKKERKRIRNKSLKERGTESERCKKERDGVCREQVPAELIG
jgi:hypothetical protein